MIKCKYYFCSLFASVHILLHIYIYTRFTLQIPLQMIHFRTCFCQTVLYHLWNLWANSKPPSWTQRVDPLGIESMNPCERIHPIKEESLMKYNEISWSGWSCGFCMKVVWLQIDTPELYYLYYLGRPVSLMLCCFSQVYCIYFYNLCIYIYKYYNMYIPIFIHSFFGSHTPNLCMQHGIMVLLFYREAHNLDNVCLNGKICVLTFRW